MSVVFARGYDFCGVARVPNASCDTRCWSGGFGTTIGNVGGPPGTSEGSFDCIDAGVRYADLLVGRDVGVSARSVGDMFPDARAISAGN